MNFLAHGFNLPSLSLSLWLIPSFFVCCIYKQILLAFDCLPPFKLLFCNRNPVHLCTLNHSPNQWNFNLVKDWLYNLVKLWPWTRWLTFTCKQIKVIWFWKPNQFCCTLTNRSEWRMMRMWTIFSIRQFWMFVCALWLVDWFFCTMDVEKRLFQPTVDDEDKDDDENDDDETKIRDE